MNNINNRKNLKTRIKYSDLNYYVTTELFSVLSRLTFGKFFRGYEVDANKELSSLFATISSTKDILIAFEDNI